MINFFQAICLFLAIGTQPIHHSADTYNKKSKVSITLQNGVFKVNGTTIDNKWSSSLFYKALGKPSPDDDNTDSKECYDNKGIIMWKEGEDNQQISQLLVQYSEDPNESWYKSNIWFTGSVTIEKLKVTAKTSADDLKKSLPQYKFKKNSMGWYEGIYNHIFMYFSYDKTEKNLLWIDFGYDEDNVME